MALGFCPKCGKKLERDSEVCPSCNTDLMDRKNMSFISVSKNKNKRMFKKALELLRSDDLKNAEKLFNESHDYLIATFNHLYNKEIIDDERYLIDYTRARERDLRNLKTETQLLRDEIDRVLKKPEEALKLDLKYEYWQKLGTAYFNKGEINKSIESYQKALTLNPKLIYIWNNLGDAYLKVGKSDKAIYAYKQIIDFKPDYKEGWCGLGLAYTNSGEYDKAIDSFKTVLDMNSKYRRAIYNLSFTLSLKDFETAINLLHKSDRENAEIFFLKSNKNLSKRLFVCFKWI